MSIGTKVEYAPLRDLYLDPLNPRLGRHRMASDTPQELLLDYMRDWVLDELAMSYLENGGFWAHEALIVVNEEYQGELRMVVVEGNRRLAALTMLKRASEGQPLSAKWKRMLENNSLPPGIFDEVPYITADSRESVSAFLGFRHVTGIKQWDADEKAAFISELVQGGLSYEEVARKIGSKAPTVRLHYIAYRVLIQIENSVEDFSKKRADRRFAILYMSLRTNGVQDYLNLNLNADPQEASTPVRNDLHHRLEHFSRWLFGTDTSPFLITDTRQVNQFGHILENEEATRYIEEDSNARFEVALKMTGGDLDEILNLLEKASYLTEVALGRAHSFRKNDKLAKVVHRIGSDVFQLLSLFPSVRRKIEDEMHDNGDD